MPLYIINIKHNLSIPYSLANLEMSISTYKLHTIMPIVKVIFIHNLEPIINMSSYPIYLRYPDRAPKETIVESSSSLRTLLEIINLEISQVSDRVIVGTKEYSLADYGDKTLEELNITANTEVNVLQHHVGGGDGFTSEFKCNSCETMAFIGFSNSAPKYRCISSGISFEGTCKNQTCIAYNQQAMCTLGFGEFDIRCYMTDKTKTPTCPVCPSKLQDCMRFGFYRCNWKISGRTSEGKKFKRKGISSERHYETFKEGENTVWQFLCVNVSPL